MTTQNDLEALERVSKLAEEVQEFLRKNSPTGAANKAIESCVEAVKARALMFRNFATIAGNEERFSVNMTLADEMLLLARDLQKFVINVDNLKNERTSAVD